MKNKNGRPSRVPGEVSSVRRWILLTKTEDAKLQRQAKQNRQKPPAYLRDLVIEFLEENDEE